MPVDTVMQVNFEGPVDFEMLVDLPGAGGTPWACEPLEAGVSLSASLADVGPSRIPPASN